MLFYILPVIAGMTLTIQSGINAQLRSALQHPWLAAFISFAVGTLALGVILVVTKRSFPDASVFSQISWYKYIGGLLGTFFVVVALLSVQRIGASNMIVLIVAGQLVTAVTLDHYGLLGIKPDPVTIQKIAGVMLVLIGAWLVNKKF